jgi:cephalosporin-C deacetylase
MGPLVAFALVLAASGTAAGGGGGIGGDTRGVSVAAREEGGYVADAPSYRAEVGADGNLHSLRVGEIEMLDDRTAVLLGFASGSFFYVNGPRKLETMTRRGRSVVEATDGTFTARYWFRADEVRVRLTNRDGRPASYFVVLSPQISIVANPSSGEAAAVPANELWGGARFSAHNGAYLETANGTRVWGPWLGRQVWELSGLQPGASQELRLRAGVGDPPQATLEQLVGASAVVLSTDALVSAEEPLTVEVSVDNRSDRVLQALLSVELAASRSDMVFYASSPVELPAKQVSQRTFRWRVDPPDFYTAKFTLVADRREVARAMAAAGNRAHEIAPAVARPPGFGPFWERVLAEVGRGTPQFRMIRDQRRSRPASDVWVVEYEGLGGKSVHGWYVVPRRRGNLPAILYLSGYGARPIDPPIALARHGYAVLAIDVRGNRVDRVRPRPFEDYCTEGIESPETYAYREIVGHALRGVHFLQGREEADPGRIAVVGVSEGGGLGVLLGALSPSVKAVAAGAPMLCDFPLSLRMAAWPYTEIAERSDESPEERSRIATTLSYFDAVNFAPDVRCPVFLSIGYLDPVSLPAAVYGLYNVLPGPKEIRGYPDAGHEGGGEDLWGHKLQWLAKSLRPAGSGP